MVIVLISRILVIILVGFSFPFMLHPTREALDTLIFTTKQVGHERLRWIVETLGLLGASLGVALAFKKLDLFLGLTGSTGSTISGFIIPGFFHMWTFREWNAKRVLSLMLVIFGVTFMSISLTLVVMECTKERSS